jgi:hypothetical protein
MAPFRNPRAWVDAARMLVPPPESASIEVRWVERDAGGRFSATLLVAGAAYARLVPGSKPGWSAGAAAIGPLAIPLPERGT